MKVKCNHSHITIFRSDRSIDFCIFWLHQVLCIYYFGILYLHFTISESPACVNDKKRRTSRRRSEDLKSRRQSMEEKVRCLFSTNYFLFKPTTNDKCSRYKYTLCTHLLVMIIIVILLNKVPHETIKY